MKIPMTCKEIMKIKQEVAIKKYLVESLVHQIMLVSIYMHFHYGHIQPQSSNLTWYTSIITTLDLNQEYNI